MGMVRAFWNEVIRAADSNWKPVALRATNNALHTQLISGGTAVGSASVGLPVVDANLVALAFAQSKAISAASSAADVFVDDSQTIPATATVALIQALTQNIRWRDDGVSPTTTKGMQLAAGDQFWYTGDLSAIEFIEEAATAEINISVYRQA